MSVANEKKDTITAKAGKCAHPVCSCVITSGKYCSTECAAMEKVAGHRMCVRTRQMQGQNVREPNYVPTGLYCRAQEKIIVL
jgi:hypothetical protein